MVYWAILNIFDHILTDSQDAFVKCWLIDWTARPRKRWARPLAWAAMGRHPGPGHWAPDHRPRPTRALDHRRRPLRPSSRIRPQDSSGSRIGPCPCTFTTIRSFNLIWIYLHTHIYIYICIGWSLVRSQSVGPLVFAQISILPGANQAGTQWSINLQRQRCPPIFAIFRVLA